MNLNKKGNGRIVAASAGLIVCCATYYFGLHILWVIVIFIFIVLVAAFAGEADIDNDD